MLRKIILELKQFKDDEKRVLLSIVEDVYFYWGKFEILDDAVQMVRNFHKPHPMSYESPLSEFPRLDSIINYNSYVVAFINITCFFEPKKNRKDDRFLLDFLKKCKTHYELLYKLSVALYEKEHMQVPMTLEMFAKMIDDLINELDNEIDKDYIKEIKTYRNKVLSHHTYIREVDIKEEVSDYLMDAKKFLENFLLIKVSKIITQIYNPIGRPLKESINLLRRKIKPELLDIIEGYVIFKTKSSIIKSELLSDSLFQELKTILGKCSINIEGDHIRINYILYSSFYDRKPNEGIKDKGHIKIINDLTKKYEIYGTQVSESIKDH